MINILPVLKSITLSGIIWSSAIIIAGLVLIKWFAWMQRKEEDRDAKNSQLWDEADMYR